MRVSISISDPWDLGEENGWKPLPGLMLQLVDDDRGGRALILLDQEVTYRGTRWRYLVARVRHQGDRIAALRGGETVLSSMIGISEEQANTSPAPDMDLWRGGLSFIGSIDPSPLRST
jgi:hypothetical protein